MCSSDLNIVWEIFVYIANNLKKVSEPHPDPGEKFEPLEVSFEDFIAIPENENFADFRGSGQLALRLTKANEDEKERQKLYKLFYHK